MNFEHNKYYSRDEIHEQVGGGKQAFLPIHDGRVVAGCFLTKHNPGAPEIVLPGFGAERERSAALLAEQGTAVPVFMKSETNRWRYVGNYRVTRRSTEAADIARNTPPNRIGDVSQVLFLERVREA